MKEERIIIEIAPDGRLTADAHGFEGDACMKDLERLLADLAAPPVAVERKDDTARSATTRRAVRLRRGGPK